MQSLYKISLAFFLFAELNLIGAAYYGSILIRMWLMKNIATGWYPTLIEIFFLNSWIYLVMVGVLLLLPLLLFLPGDRSRTIYFLLSGSFLLLFAAFYLEAFVQVFDHWGSLIERKGTFWLNY